MFTDRPILDFWSVYYKVFFVSGYNESLLNKS